MTDLEWLNEWVRKGEGRSASFYSGRCEVRRAWTITVAIGYGDTVEEQLKEGRRTAERAPE